MTEGLSFGAYRVVRKIGQGGMGAVYLGEHTLIGRRAAIKVLQRDRSSQRENVERFFTEARATSAVEDPGIVQIYDFGVTPTGTAYLVMEFLDGEALSARLRRLRLLTPHEAVRIARQVAGSLASAHSLGIVHRDLKPENLFMVRDSEASAGERAKILDFGIAKLGDDDRERFRTRTGAVMGTPAYMSPEQCNDTGKIDHRTDIYSLGCVLFHLLTGRPPFDVSGVGATIAAHLREPAPQPSVIAPGVPAIVDPLVARCLAKDPEDRFSTMVELQKACEAVLAALPAESTTTAKPLPPPVTAMPPREDATTTLGNSVGESSASEGARKKLWLVASLGAIAAGILLAVMTTKSDAPSTSSTTVTPASSMAPATTTVPATSAAPAAPAASTETPPQAGSAAEASAPPASPTPAPAPTVSEPTVTEPTVTPKETAPAKATPTRKSKKKKPAGGLYEDRI